MTPDRDDFEQILPLLSVPAEVHDPSGLHRRRFLQGALAAGLGMAAGPTLPGLGGAARAFAASPVAPHEGILVVVVLGGAIDGLNTVVPTGQSAYYSRRKHIAIPASQAIPLRPGVGMHPGLRGIASRYSAGKVAIVQGVGHPGNSLSHFDATETVFAGTVGSARSTGWIGRWLDGVSESGSGMRGITIGSTVPLHMIGQRAIVTAMSPWGIPWGGTGTHASTWEKSLIDALVAYRNEPTRRGPWGDRVAALNGPALSIARQLSAVYPERMPELPFDKQMVLASRLVNADLGVRVINTTLLGWDTHVHQLYHHDRLLRELDTGLSTLFSQISERWRSQVSVLLFSEFGRRVDVNASNGTDHGTANVMLAVGDRVQGGLHGQMPSLGDLDSRGNLRIHVDARQVWTSVLDQFLGGGSSAVIGRSFPGLSLFRP
jgi:uncharacterized protein (DUF1501 family)